ncbi:MAG: lipoprotein [Verrucomicrobia bacterium]|nr:lipoprotein [Verrucomicrobiota bacterium]
MKRLILLLGAVLLLTGCDSLESLPTPSERYGKVEPKVRTFESDYRTTYFAAQLALKRMDWVLTKSALAQGIVNGRSAVHSENAFSGQNRQYTIEVRLNEVDDRHTEVSVLLHEQIEGDFQAGATDRTLREHGLYDSFYASLDQVLREGVPVPDPEK